MAENSRSFASVLRHEIAQRNRRFARNLPHVDSYGSPPIVVYSPENGRHGNFFDPAYAAIAQKPDWLRRFDKVHTQARRSLPKANRRWRELDSCMSSDALLMNIFCTPGVLESPALRGALAIDAGGAPIFGWKARVPLRNGRFDRTEVDMRLGSLLVEAKLTESDFQTCAPSVVDAYRDFDAVFDRALLPQIEVFASRPKPKTEFPEDYSQEYEEQVDPDLFAIPKQPLIVEVEPALAGYQLIRSVLAAQAEQCSFCVLLDQRRPDLREAWFSIMAAVKDAQLRVRLLTLTWQELAALLPEPLQNFLDLKYGIVPPGNFASPLDEFVDLD